MPTDFTARITEIVAAHCGRFASLDTLAAQLAKAAEEHYRPRIETVEALNALPDGTFVRSAYGEIMEHRRGKGWWRYGADPGLPLELPAVVLWSPGAGE